MDSLDFKKILLKELLNFAQDLLTKGKKDENGMYWESLEISARGADRKLNDTIFTGTTGVVLFFISLFKYTKDIRHLKTAVLGSTWIENYIKDTPKAGYPSFYSGRTGVSYMFIKLFEVTGERDYLGKSLNNIKGLEDKLKRTNLSSDLLSGIAGNVFVITYLYTHLKDKYLLSLINTCLQNLLDKIIIAKKGLKWNYSIIDIDSLCGLSHGASGIAFVFLEIGRCFGNNSFFWLAHQAMMYESEYYDHESNNWLDLRVPSFEIAEKAYIENKNDFFRKTTDDDYNFWSHGAVGVGLVRLLAFEYTNNEKYLMEAERAIKKTIETDFIRHRNSSYIISQGKAGNAELFFEAYRITGDLNYLNYTREIASQVITFRQKSGHFPRGLDPNKDDNGLFLGRTGIGYFLLRCLDAENIDSILLPRIKKKLSSNRKLPEFGMLNISKSLLKKKIYGKYFNRTFTCLESLDISSTAEFFNQDVIESQDNELQMLAKKLEEVLSSLPENYKKVIEEVFEMEYKSQKLISEGKSYIYISIEHKINKEKYSKLANIHEKLYESDIRLSDHVKIIFNQWNWYDRDDRNYLKNLYCPPASYPTLLIRKAYHVEEFPVNKVCASIFELMKKNSKIDIIVKEVVKIFARKKAKHISKIDITKLVHEQIKGLIRENIIEIV